ncbi:DUF4352 domain-containing protein [Lactobacillus sp. CC-MHH1034]|uniref:DUF4352 domain-containing protein n=1 Tax=Agrilactobacillus fermenti TaxID=2586909 RepID=UPI001E5717A1|nr:DUF4352 domain-containing protein [Agrilactobacillus fermenti]MCD2256344.1 DUF4352 domain-containing protein [Agrilactobacillus fermenti]
MKQKPTKLPFYLNIWFYLTILLALSNVIIFMTISATNNHHAEQQIQLKKLQAQNKQLQHENKNYRLLNKTLTNVQQKTDAVTKNSKAAAKTPIKPASFGQTQTYADNIKVTVNTLQFSDETPDQNISDTQLIKIQFQIENGSHEELHASGVDFAMYDGKRQKATEDTKDFYAEVIAPQMTSSGTLYFHAKNAGPYTIQYNGKSWQTAQP